MMHDDKCSHAYCCVLYGNNPEYLLLLLVLARRLKLLADAKHAEWNVDIECKPRQCKRRNAPMTNRWPPPLLVLPTEDVLENSLNLLRTAGCVVLDRVRYLHGHPALFAHKDGRHQNVLTKIRVLALAQYRKVLLIDADVLPRKSLESLFDLEPPAAMLMPAYLKWAQPLSARTPVPTDWFEISCDGTGARINSGVCLLCPDQTLLDEIEAAVSPLRQLNVSAEGVVDGPLFGHAWYPSWTPDEDVLTRALVARGAEWTHIGCSFNYEVVGDNVYFPQNPIGLEHAEMDYKESATFHYIGKWKPSWYALNGFTVKDAQKDYRTNDDPRDLCSWAVSEWFEAFDELRAHAARAWKVDVIDMVRESSRT